MVAVAMILRVWVIYDQSRIILGILLTIYIVEIVSLVVSCVTLSISHIGIQFTCILS